MNFLIYLISFLFVFSSVMLANEKTDLKNLVKQTIDQVTVFLADKNLDKRTRNKKIIETISSILDFNKMAKLSLGRKYWKKFDKDQRARFTTLFVTRLQESFLEKLDLYTDEKVFYGHAKKLKKNKIEILVQLVSKDSKIDMLFKFSKPKKKGWKGYDLKISGVSVIQTYRSQFDSVIKKKGIEELLIQLGKTGEFKIPTEKE